MKRNKKDKEFNRIADAIQDHKYQCNCGHKMFIHKNNDKKVCSWCGNFIFKSKRDEFKYRTMEKLRRKNNESKFGVY